MLKALYHQLPVRSPISLPALALAARRRNDGAAPEELRELLRRQYAAARVILTASGTQALQLAIRAAARRTGEATPRLAIPAFTCFDLGTAAVWSGLPIVAFDLDPDTLAPDLESVEEALRGGARILVVSPLYGVPVPWAALSELADRYGAVLVEDAAQGHGARWSGRRLGSLGGISVLSFGRGKGWTGGHGGAVLFRGVRAEWDHHAVAGEVAPARGSGLTASAAQWALGRPRLYGIPTSLPWLGLGETRYHEPVTPAAMPAAACALALASHAAAEHEARGRLLRAREFALRLDPRRARAIGVDGVPGSDPRAEGDEPGFLRLPVRVADARRAVAALGRWGVAPSYPIPLPALEPVRSRIAGGPSAWPGAATLVRELVTLPTHGWVSERDRERIIRGLRQGAECPGAG